jgi:hypothetical protein
MDGNTDEVSDYYNKKIIGVYDNEIMYNIMGQENLKNVERYGNCKAKFENIKTIFTDSNGISIPVAEVGCNIKFILQIRSNTKIENVNVAITIYDFDGNRLIDVNTLIKGKTLSLNEGEVTEVTFSLKNVLLNENTYVVGLWLGISNIEDIDGIRYSTSFKLESRKQDILYTKPFPGFYLCDYEFEIN